MKLSTLNRPPQCAESPPLCPSNRALNRPPVKPIVSNTYRLLPVVGDRPSVDNPLISNRSRTNSHPRSQPDRPIGIQSRNVTCGIGLPQNRPQTVPGTSKQNHQRPYQQTGRNSRVIASNRDFVASGDTASLVGGKSEVDSQSVNKYYAIMLGCADIRQSLSWNSPSLRRPIASRSVAGHGDDAEEAVVATSLSVFIQP